MTDNASSIVELRKVSYEVQGLQILADIDLRIERSEVLVLLGESGCGKTTTLKLINRLIEPTSGDVRVDGRSTRDWNMIELRRRIGNVLQDGGLFPHMSVAENVALPLTLADAGESVAKVRADEMLSLVGLEPAEFRARYPHELSGGQRQRVGVARALVSDPDLLLLDEPFGALDAITRARLQKEFARLVRDLGKTAVFVTHDLNEAMTLATRIALMDKGRIVVNDTPENFRASTLPLVREYFDTILT